MQALDPSAQSWLARWRRQFIAAAATLALLKLGLALYVGAKATQIALLPLLFGADVLGAACVAAVAAALPAWWWAAAVQALHGFIAAISTLSVVQIGGHINRSFLGLTAMKLADWTPSMAASTADYFGPRNLVVIGLAVAVGVTLALRPPMSDAWGLRRRAALGALVLATFGFLPVAKGGWIGLRLQTHDVEKSPWIELAGSYVRPAVRALLPGAAGDAADRFRFDWTSLHGADAPLVTPLSRAAPRATNLVIILQESIGRRYVDHPDDPMPWLRGLMSDPDAVTLDDHHATWSLTTKALFSLLCSEMPYPTYRPISFVNPAIPCTSLSDTLRKAGWATALITPQHLEFDRLMRFLRHRGFETIWDATNLPGSEGKWQAAWGFEDSVAVDALLGWVKARKAEAPQRPFFVLYQQVSGHHPFIASEAQEKSPSPDRVGNYLRALTAADEAAKATVEGLRALDLLDDTLIVVVADHGEGHGRLAGRNAYEPVIRVPAVLFGPQTRGLGGAGPVTTTTSMIDLAPTLLALLDQPVPCPMQGRNLADPQVERRFALFGGRPPKFQIGVADGAWHYILEDGRRSMLFDRASDPDHERDLAADRPEVVEGYERRVQAWRDHSAALIEDYAVRLAGSGCPPP